MSGQVPEWAALVEDKDDPSRRAYFEVTRDGAELERVELGASPSIVFGRNPDMTDVLLEHPSISRRHAAVLHDGKGGVSLYDFGSTHGTFVDGQRLVARDPTRLKDGSKVRFADSSRLYVFRLPTSPGSGSFPMPAPKAPKQPTTMAPPPAVEKKKKKEVEEQQVPEEAFDDSIREQLPTSFGGSVKHGGAALSKEAMAKGVAEMMAQIAAQEEARKKREAEGDSKEEERDDDDDDDDNDDYGPTPVKGGGGRMDVDGGGGGKPEKKKEDDDALTKYRLPVSHEVSLRGHSKVITCIGVNNAGNRVAVGSTDYRVLLYDFGGMDRTHKPFRELTADDGNGVVALSFPSTGDRFLCATSSAQPKVFDRDGVMQIQFVKGDPYIADMAQTKGHTRNVTAAQWHPVEKDLVMTAGIDGTIRLWDLNGKTTFDKLINKTVFKARSQRNTSVPVTSASFSSNGEWVVAGCDDGSIQGYSLRKKVWIKPDLMIRPGHRETTAVTCVMFSPDGNKIASRAMDDTVKLWDVRKPSSPLVVYEDIMTYLDTSNVAFSPDGKVLCVGTNVRKNEGTGLLKFFDTATAKTESVAQLGVAPCHSVVTVVWHPRIRQIICGTTGGETKVLYDPLISEKGALMSATRVKRLKDPSDFVSISSSSAAVGEIHNPNALPMFQKERGGKRKREKDRLDPLKSKRPELPVNGPGFGGRVSGSYTFTQLVMKNRIKDTTREQDPREAILKFAEKAKEGPQLVGKAYAQTAPAPVFQEKTLEEEMEEREKVEQDILDNK